MEVEHLNGKINWTNVLVRLNGSFGLKHHHLWKCVLSAEDLRQHNDKLVELNSSKMALQMKLDELEAAEVNIKVIHIFVLRLFF